MIHNPFLIALCVVGVCLFAPVFAWWVSGPLARTVDAVIDVVRMVWYDFVLDKPLLITSNGLDADIVDWPARLDAARGYYEQYKDDDRAQNASDAAKAGVDLSAIVSNNLPKAPVKGPKKGPSRRRTKKSAPKPKKRGRTK